MPISTYFLLENSCKNFVLELLNLAIWKNSLNWLKLSGMTVYYKSSVKRHESESQSACFKKTKHGKFSEKLTFLTPWDAHVRMFVFRNIWRALFSWSTRFEIRLFALLPTKWCWWYYLLISDLYDQNKMVLVKYQIWISKI